MNPKTADSILLGRLIRHIRIERNWTQKSLAFYLDVSIHHVRMIESGKTMPAKNLEAKMLHWFKNSRM
jgi:transcriptional regulator with XRE-family HTH domain